MCLIHVSGFVIHVLDLVTLELNGTRGKIFLFVITIVTLTLFTFMKSKFHYYLKIKILG